MLLIAIKIRSATPTATIPTMERVTSRAQAAWLSPLLVETMPTRSRTQHLQVRLRQLRVLLALLALLALPALRLHRLLTLFLMATLYRKPQYVILLQELR